MSSTSSITADDGLAHQAEMACLASVFFSPLSQLGQLTPVDESDLPPAYQTLLAHHSHMTVTLEAFHSSLVDVHVLQERSSGQEGSDGQYYARKSLLSRQSDGRVVQLGIMRIDLSGLPQDAKRDIETHQAPLGRILIRSGVLREVDLIALWRIEPGDELRQALKPSPGETVWGRSARILVDGRPTVELLEIIR